MNIFKGGRRRKVIKTIIRDVFSVSLITIIRMTNDICQNNWNVSFWIFPFILFSYIKFPVFDFILDIWNCIIVTERFTGWIWSYVSNKLFILIKPHFFVNFLEQVFNLPSPRSIVTNYQRSHAEMIIEEIYFNFFKIVIYDWKSTH